jgi:aminoglycoside phosphotransferase (APT) family kinase protein
MIVGERAAVRERLRGWFARRMPEWRDVEVSEPRTPLGTGNSAETSFVDVSYTSGGIPRHRKMVLRRQVEGSDLFLNADLATPYRMMDALKGHPHIRVPQTRGIEFDRTVLGSPFLVMDAVEGRVVDQMPNYNVSGWVADLDPSQRRALWFNAIDMIAELHKVDWRDGFEFLDEPVRGRPGLDQYLDWVREWYLWARKDRPQPVADAVLDYLFANKPADTVTGVLWGDATPANILFAPDLSVAAILDFEMAALGPGEVDLAWWLFFDDFYGPDVGIPRLPGLPDRDETIARYEQAAGRPVRNPDYYAVLARFRMNIVGIRWVDRLVAQGRLEAGTDVLTHNVITKQLAIQLGLPVPEPGEGFARMVAASVKSES